VAHGNFFVIDEVRSGKGIAVDSCLPEMKKNLLNNVAILTKKAHSSAL